MEYKKQNIENRKWNSEFKTLSQYFPFSNFQPLCSAHNRGVATLPTVLVLGVVALAVAVGITSVSLTESFISQGGAQSSRALFYAEAGARDALIKIARNKNYTCSAADCYTIDFSTNGCSLSNDCAKVSVSGTGATGDPKIVTSKGIMKAGTRIMQVSVILDGGTGGNGEITSAVWTELTN
jgi:Tfp pilus assembly protein PilX